MHLYAMENKGIIEGLDIWGDYSILLLYNMIKVLRWEFEITEIEDDL